MILLSIESQVIHIVAHEILDYVYGINPVLACLSAKRRTFQKLYVAMNEKGEGRKSSPKIEQILKMATSYGVKVKYLHKVSFSWL